MPSVTLAGVSKRFPGGVDALHPTDLHVEPGERLVLLGPGGSGKTTLLRLVAGLEDPDAGEVRIGGRPMTRVPPHRRGVGMTFQKPALYPQWTVRRNLEVGSTAVGSRQGKQPVPTAHCPLPTAVELLQIGHLLDRHPHQLSAGERQRAALARLVAAGPPVWLLDEPFAALDPLFRSEFRADLHLLLEHARPTILLVTHDPIDAPALGHRVGVLGDGRLQQLGTPGQLHDRPANRFVASALGRFCFIDGVVDGGDPGGWRFATPDGSVALPLPTGLVPAGGSPPARSLTLGIRPEDVLSRPPDSPPPTEPGAVLTGWPVVLAEPVGSGWLLTLARVNHRVRAWLASGPPPPVGAPTSWFIPARRCHWFDAPSGRRVELGI